MAYVTFFFFFVVGQRKVRRCQSVGCRRFGDMTFQFVACREFFWHRLSLKSCNSGVQFGRLLNELTHFIMVSYNSTIAFKLKKV